MSSAPPGVSQKSHYRNWGSHGLRFAAKLLRFVDFVELRTRKTKNLIL